MEALEQASGAATGIVRRRRVDQGRLQRILIVESHGEQARDEKARAGHSGRALASASSSGCHSKKPEHPARSLHPSQGGTYFRFQSEIDGTASARYASGRSEEHTSELQSLMRISYAVFCLKKKKTHKTKEKDSQNKQKN